MNTIESYNNLPIPGYALPYLVNGDDSGIEPDDKQAIDNYMAQFYQTAQNCGGGVVISVESNEGYFTHYPEFGLPCNCYDCTIAILA
jgi:hypothetical protein